MSPTGDRCGDLILGFAFGLGCLIGGHLTDTAPLAIGGLFLLLLCLSGLVVEPAKRNRSASNDLSSLGRDRERVAFEDLYPNRKRAS